MAESVGGGGTHLSTEVSCPSCGEKRAQVHTILSGGTYAQVCCHDHPAWVVSGYTDDLKRGVYLLMAAWSRL